MALGKRRGADTSERYFQTEVSVIRIEMRDSTWEVTSSAHMLVYIAMSSTLYNGR